MRRSFRLVRLFVAASLSAQLEYRATFFASALESVAQVGVGLLGLALFLRHGDSLGGWSYPQAALVLGLFTLTQGFISVALQPNLSRIAEGVREGGMDFTLLKPLDAQFLVSTRNLNLFRLSDALVGAGIVVWAVAHLPEVTPGGLLLGALLYLCALVMVYSVWFALSTTAFWWVKVQNITELFQGAFGAGRFPVSAFPAPVRFALTFVLPIAFITTVPAQAALGQISPALVLLSPLAALALWLFSRLFWLYALRSYTSASS